MALVALISVLAVGVIARIALEHKDTVKWFSQHIQYAGMSIEDVPRRYRRAVMRRIKNGLD